VFAGFDVSANTVVRGRRREADEDALRVGCTVLAVAVPWVMDEVVGAAAGRLARVRVRMW